MTNPANPFDRPDSTPTISWAITDAFGNKSSVPIGTRQGGVVVKAPEVVQSTGYAANKELAGRPLFWSNNKGEGKVAESHSPDGRPNKPVQQIVTILKVNGEDRALWTSMYPPSQFNAIQNAIKGADGKARAIEPGDELYITLIGFEKNEDTTKNASKLYSAEFIKGAGVFAPAPPPPPAPTSVVASPPPPPVASGEPVLSNGFTESALKASGWTAEQIAALKTPAVAPAPPAAVDPTSGPAAAEPTAPSPTAVAELTERDKRIAAMSEEDRKLLNLV